MERLRLSRAKEILMDNDYVVSESMKFVSFRDKVMDFLKEQEHDTDDIFKRTYDVYCREYGNGSDAYSVAKAMITKYRFMKHWGEV